MYIFDVRKSSFTNLNERVTQNGENTGNGANQNGSPWLNGHRCGSTHGDTSGQSGILNVLHGDLTAGSGPDWSCISHHTGTAQSQVGIDNGKVTISTLTGSRVEWWPEHPQENGTNQGENIGVVFTAYNFIWIKSKNLHKLTLSWIVNVTLLEQATGDGKTKVSTESVNN